MRRCAVLLLVLVTLTAQAQGLPTREGMPTLAPILEKVTPAVVNIAVLQVSPEEENPLMRDPFFRRFFGMPQQAEPQIAAGSGVIVDAKNGYVVTNAHVVKDAREIQITLKDNRRLPAKLVGADPGTDIAVLRVEPNGLVEAKWGDSDTLQVGDFVMAIGNPFGLGQTATSGIVSALGRSGLSVEGYEHFIQTDAPINPGNSGGALINLKGELIGINSAIIGPAELRARLGVVPAGETVELKVLRGKETQVISARVAEIDKSQTAGGQTVPELNGASLVEVERRGLPGNNRAVLVNGVEAGTPAFQHGVRPGDLIIGVNQRRVTTVPELGKALRASGRVALNVVRGDFLLTIQLR